MKFRPLPSQDLLLRLFEYDVDTGLLYRKTKNKKWNNKPAGCYRTRRGGKAWLVLVHVGELQYPAHRIIWLMMTGEDPSLTIDHIDRNPFNNSWSNLRLADDWLQSQNRELAATAGHKGISFDKATKRWRARKVVDGKRVSVGAFSTKEEAIEAMTRFIEDLKQKDPKWSLVYQG
jgi:hypothetical protein